MLIVRRELRKEYDVWILCAPCEFSNMIVYILLSLGLISHVNCKGKLLPYELPQIKGFSLVCIEFLYMQSAMAKTNRKL